VVKKFLRRFLKLENTPENIASGVQAMSSRRFECLEIGDKRIEIAITDRQVLSEEKAAENITYYYYCPYCGKYNPADAVTCSSCNHDLGGRLTGEYSKKALLLKKCACGTMNQKDRRNCWVCGKDFSLMSGEEVNKESDNVITLNIDGKTYKSTDKNLPWDILILMDKIRQHGYDPKIIDEWVKERNSRAQNSRLDIDTRLSQIRNALSWRIVALACSILFIMFQISSCIRYILR